MIVGLCGYAGVGKDTAALNMEGWKRVAFADALKTDLAGVLLTLGVNVFTSDPAVKEKIRPLLGAWGAVARSFDQAHWIKRLTDNIPSGNVVVTDVRYQNEVAALIACDALVIRIIRPGTGPANPEETTSFGQIDRAYRLPTVLNDQTPEILGRRILAHVEGWKK